VESEKKNLIATIESELNDKRAYSMSRLLRILCREDTFGVPRLGETEAVAKITPELKKTARSEQ
jgi:predicted Zn-dependent peptidase